MNSECSPDAVVGCAMRTEKYDQVNNGLFTSNAAATKYCDN
jgi:hypothetical protein